MQELEKILEEIEEATRQEDAPVYCGNMEVDGYVRLSVVEEIIRKHLSGKGINVPTNDGWIPVEERLPEVCKKIEEDSECHEYNVTIMGAEKATTLKYSPADETWFDDLGYVYPVIAWRLCRSHTGRKGVITMTENEAIEIIWGRHMDCDDYRLQFDSYPDGYDFEFDQAILMAAQALKEVQQYRKIGTVEECREAVEKQKPKEPTVLKQQHSDSYNCPKCGRNLILKCGTDWFGGQHYNSCPNCGQAIRWDENLEGMEDE